METENEVGFTSLLDYLFETHGFDFSGYKRTSLARRIGKRLQTLGTASYEDYLAHLQTHPQEFQLLFDTVLINVTGFYRDREAWDFIRSSVIPTILSNADGRPLRVWSAGCASGEEAYTLAMLLADALGAEAFRQRIKVYATDIDEAAIQTARAGVYPLKDLEALPETLRERYFDAQGARASFRADLRRCIVFGRHDLAQDAPLSRIDLLCCRNTLMYFTAPTQSRILARFHYALNDRGYLVLGRAEMLLTHADLFSPVEVKQRIFVKTGSRDEVLRMLSMQPRDGESAFGREVLVRELMLEVLPIATMFVDAKGMLVFANARMRDHFGISLRDAGKPFHELEVSYRPAELRASIDDAVRDKRAVVIRGVEHRRWNGGDTDHLDVVVTPLLGEDGIVLGTTITFENVTEFHRLQSDLTRSTEELETAYEELQSTNEELETTNEELQSTVEELETTNEELQSANEELETMNEELQSTNAELQRSVTDLRLRSDELDGANFFIDSVLMSLNFGVAVVDAELRVQVWNRRNEDLWGVRSSEVSGMPIAEVDAGFPVDTVVDAISACLERSSGDVEVMMDAVNRKGRAIRCRVVCTPLRLHRDRAGVVVLFEEVSPQPHAG